jgi:hypothetical protein
MKSHVRAAAAVVAALAVLLVGCDVEGTGVDDGVDDAPVDQPTDDAPGDEPMDEGADDA